MNKRTDILGGIFVIFIIIGILISGNQSFAQAHSAVRVGNDIYHIGDDRSLMVREYQQPGFTEIDTQLVADAKLKALFLYKNKYVVGHTVHDGLYMLVPDENGRLCTIVNDGNRIKKHYSRHCNWIQIGEEVSKVYVDDTNILVVYNGQWAFSKPVLMLFTEPENGIVQPTRHSLEYSCGLGCKRALGSTFGTSLPDWKWPFENLELINFDHVGYDKNKKITVAMEGEVDEDGPSFPLTLLLKYKNKFKSAYWYKDLVASKDLQKSY